MNIYLDIDGVLIGDDMRPTKFSSDFIKYIVTNYPDSTYWLTSLCHGDAEATVKNIGYLFDAETVELMKKIKPTMWQNSIKSSAIDFSQPFLWFDDSLLINDRINLIEHQVLDNYIEIDLRKDPGRLELILAAFPQPVNHKIA